ncbi:MAG: hypothetical protein AB7E13_01325 [Arcobacteraceae bacterium]
MTQRDMAGYLGVTTVTLRNWKKYKPNLYKTIMKGFEFDEMVKNAKESYEKAKELQNKYESNSS